MPYNMRAMHTLSLTNDGRVYSYGCNDKGALGRVTDGDERLEATPTIKNKITKVCAGDSHSAVLTDKQEVFVWGNFRDEHGSVGLTPCCNGEPSYGPIQIMAGTKFIDIASGSNHMLLLDTSGTVYSFGVGAQGQLGRIGPDQLGEDCKITAENRELFLTPHKVSLKDVDPQRPFIGASKELQPPTSSQIVETPCAKRGRERFNLLKTRPIVSEFDSNKILTPIEALEKPKESRFSETGFGKRVKEPKPEELNVKYTLIDIVNVNHAPRVLFYCKVKNELDVIEEKWLDLIIVDKLEPRSIFMDFLARVFLFHRTYTYMLKAAEACDNEKRVDGRDKYSVKLYPLIEPSRVIPVSYRKIKDKIVAQSELMSHNRYSAKRAAKRAKEGTLTDKRLRELERGNF